MGRPFPLLWVALLMLLLIPTAAGRILINIAGGLMIASLLIPILIAGFGWIGWRVLQSQMVTCESCGIRTLKNNDNCPMCGTSFSSNENTSKPYSESNFPSTASNATIDVQAEEINSDS